MELSTSIPAAKVMPAKLMMLRLRSSIQSVMNVPMMLMGMANPITRVVLPVRRNKYKTVIARRLPRKRLRPTKSREL